MNRSRISKIIGLIVLVGFVLVLASGCSSTKAVPAATFTTSLQTASSTEVANQYKNACCQ